jgi:hypothetical protein
MVATPWSIALAGVENEAGSPFHSIVPSSG